MNLMDNINAVLHGLQAQIHDENMIRDSRNPSWILRTLRTVAFTDLDERHKVRVRKVIWHTSAPTMTAYTFNQRFEAYLNLGSPPPLQVPRNGIIVGADQLNQVIFDGAEGVISVTFGMSGWFGLTLTSAPRGNIPSYLLGDTSQAKNFRKKCRLLANVLVLLNVYGQRFIRARTLLNTFNSGYNFGTLSLGPSRESRKLLDRIHSVSSDVLWGPYLQQGIRRVVIKKWKATNEINPEGDDFLQVAWE